ncbi:response regulator transcription factor [Dichotomicrobium thermohalophilum]|uniref:LuxR family two component transcriptional regulator n=1 Tax=Dichotomicrobium thermohalophilum TaxID=933063 RepID=A0A397PE75_9HYPH|nr:LuxR C-terminal-related transcriptional regulator [Dichotomicrobium thermohalophilum]RIA47800.1 LuxR family two component transcriptional regulator [Dichotomicrobium thermohalophilum]
MIDQDVICVVEQSFEDREIINRSLSRAGYLVKDYEHAAAFLDELATVHADCAIVDVRLPDIEVPSFVSELGRTRPDICCIIAANSGDIPLAMEAMKAGAVDFVEKPVDAELLIQALRAAIAARPRKPKEASHPLQPSVIQRLTPRQRDVLDLLLQGYQNKMIAFELGISQRTVEVYRAKLMRRLGASSFAELVRVALEERYMGSGVSDAQHDRH